ncbi:MAG: hypothetical protein LBK25_08895, partial [Treponema sp.]|nr:hypothetical protein [Treponema sp.]
LLLCSLLFKKAPPGFNPRRLPLPLLTAICSLLITPLRLRFACPGQRRLLPNNAEIPLARQA